MGCLGKIGDINGNDTLLDTNHLVRRLCCHGLIPVWLGAGYQKRLDEEQQVEREVAELDRMFNRY